MKKRTKVIITSLSLVAILGVTTCINHEYHPSYKIVGNINTTKPYATYSSGDVYIIKLDNKDVIDNIVLNKNDIVILDDRDSENPNMQVLSSSSIYDKEKRNEIIEIMQDYNNKYPNNWNRTNTSLRLEWFVHNLLFDFNYKLDHTTDVDLDNNDEDYYNKPILNRILNI